HATDALWKVVLATALCELCFYYNDLYDLTRVHAKRELLVGVLRGTGAAAIAVAIVSVLVPSLLIGTGTFTTVVAVLLVVVPLWRLAFDGLISDPHLEERIVLVGTGGLARIVAHQIRQQHDFAYRVVGFIADSDTPADEIAVGPVLGMHADLPRIIAARRINRVVVGLSDRRGRLPIEELLRAK